MIIYINNTNKCLPVNSLTELGLYVGSLHPKGMSEMPKSPCKKKEKKKLLKFVADPGEHSNLSV